MALEAGGFVLGLSGIITVLDTSFKVLQSISETQNLGKDLLGSLMRLSMEYYRITTWAKLLPPVQGSPRSNAPETITSSETGPDLQLQKLIRSAAAQVLSILQEIHEVIEKYPVETAVTVQTEESSLPATSPRTVSVALPFTTMLSSFGVHYDQINSVLVQQHRLASTLQQKTSLRRKFTFSSRPWGDPHKKILEDKINRLCYWNDSLENLLLPRALDKMIRQRAIPGRVLLDENEPLLDEIINNTPEHHAAVSQHAQLWRERIRVSQATWQGSELNQYQNESVEIEQITPKNLTSDIRLVSLVVKGAKRPATMEEYDCSNWNPADFRLAKARLAQLIDLSRTGHLPQTLLVQKGICFSDTGSSLRLICDLPENAMAEQPVCLHWLISPDGYKFFRKPELGQRYMLALALANSVHTLGLARWFHKDLNSSNIIFFRSSRVHKESISLQEPYISGFSIARPDKEGEKSLNRDREIFSIYLHPDLRDCDSEKDPSRYSRKYEIYALGLLLLEIGTWKRVEDIVKNVRVDLNDPLKFTEAVIDRCNKDLPFFMGNRYTDVVRLCLKCDEIDSQEDGLSLDKIYWSVVYELEKASK